MQPKMHRICLNKFINKNCYKILFRMKPSHLTVMRWEWKDITAGKNKLTKTILEQPCMKHFLQTWHRQMSNQNEILIYL